MCSRKVLFVSFVWENVVIGIFFPKFLLVSNSKSGSSCNLAASFVLELGGIDEIENCTFEDLVLALSRMWEYDYEYIILTPPAPINSVLFIQMYVVDENTALVEMSVGENGKGKLYNKKCSKQETQALFYNFFNERKSPSIIGFRETQFK